MPRKEKADQGTCEGRGSGGPRRAAPMQRKAQGTGWPGLLLWDEHLAPQLHEEPPDGDLLASSLRFYSKLLLHPLEREETQERPSQSHSRRPRRGKPSLMSRMGSGTWSEMTYHTRLRHRLMSVKES